MLSPENERLETEAIEREKLEKQVKLELPPAEAPLSPRRAWWIRLGDWFVSLFSPRVDIAQAPAPSISTLYVVHVDFKLGQDHLKLLTEQLNPIKEKFGLDFIILDPGMKFSRFEDIGKQ